VMETRVVTVTKDRQEMRHKTITVSRMIPETKTVTRTCTVPEAHVGTKTVNYTVHHPVWKDVERTYTVMVPYKKRVHGTRTVCKLEPVTVTRTVCEDQGHWEVQACPPAPCGGCGGKGCRRCGPPCAKKVWVPHIVHREVPCTVMRPKYYQVPYEHDVTCFRPDTRSCTVRVMAGTRPDVRTRRVNYTYFVPRTVERQVPVTTYRCVQEEKVVPCPVTIPYTVEKEIQVPVCRMVPQTVACRVPVCSACAD